MPSRILAACATVSLLALFYLFLDKVFFSNEGIPDMSLYRDLRVMSSEEFPINDLSKRVLIVGDIHGNFDHLQTLLTSLSYNNTKDTLIHVGDVVTKGPHQGSLDVLSYLSSNGIAGVRGNKDQKVVEWRCWTNWISSFEGSDEFLRSARVEWEKAKSEGQKLKKWNKQQHKRASKALKKKGDGSMDKATARWWQRIPENWVLFEDAYMISKDISDKDYEYLLSLPLRIYVPDAHLFIVHAGMLSHDPEHEYDHPSQPLMHAFQMTRWYASAYRNGNLRDFRDAMNPLAGWLAQLALFSRGHDIEHRNNGIVDARREKQERAVLGLALNKDPWVTLNIRSVEKGKPTRSNKRGTPWAEIWNTDMNMCRGFGENDEFSASSGKRRVLPCLPMSVVYGHAAARDLDIKRWTFGLDTGCVYGARLTAMVLGGTPSNDPDHDVDYQPFPFGDAGYAHTASIRCK